MLAINKDKIQCFFGFRTYKVLTAFISDKANPHTCSSCSSKWLDLFSDGINKFYIQPGIPISQEGWTNRIQAIAKCNVFHANKMNEISIFSDNLQCIHH